MSILIDGQDSLIGPLSELFELIYRDQVMPGQWLISKIIPVHKKGAKNYLIRMARLVNQQHYIIM